MTIKERLEELKNKKLTKEELKEVYNKLVEEVKKDYKERPHAPLTESCRNLSFKFLEGTDEPNSTVVATDGFNYLILVGEDCNMDIMDTPREYKLQLLKEQLKEMKDKYGLEEEYNYWMGIKEVKELMTESLDEMKDLAEKLYNHFEENERFYEIYPENDNTICADINWGDWKHDHLYFDYESEKFLNSLGYDVVSFNTDVTDEDGSDTYSAIHSLIIKKK